MQVPEGEACPLHTRQAASLSSTSPFFLLLHSLGRAGSTEGAQLGPEGPSPGEEFIQVLQYKPTQASRDLRLGCDILG